LNGLLVKPDLSVGTFRVWQRHRDVMLKQWVTEAIGFMVEPWMVIFALGLGLGQFVTLDGGERYITFLAPGLLALFPMFVSVFECAWGSYVRLEMQGTYRAIVATPVSVDDVVAGDIVWGMTRAVLNTAYILLVLVILNHWVPTVSSGWAVLVVPLSVLPGLLFSSMSMCFVSLARAMSQFNYFFNLVINPMFWFGGAFFPFDRLPHWAQVLGWFVPLSHVVRLYRGLLAGDLEWSMLGSLIWLLVATAVFNWVALAAMRRRLIE
jgi:lipooligosaccharide transport system permease protein